MNCARIAITRFCSSDTAAHSDYFVLMRLLNTLTHSLTRMLQSLLDAFGLYFCQENNFKHLQLKH